MALLTTIEVTLYFKTPTIKNKKHIKLLIMKQNHHLLKVIFIILLFCGFVSCDTEDRNIKRALKENALLDGTKYKLTEYRITETILKTNIEDSILSGHTSIIVQKQLMRMDSLKLNEYIQEREQCKADKRNTYGYLASIYDSLIKEWQDMVDYQDERLAIKQRKIDEIKDEIKNWESLIENADDHVIYYIIKHQYILDEKHVEREVLLTTKYEII